MIQYNIILCSTEYLYLMFKYHFHLRNSVQNPMYFADDPLNYYEERVSHLRIAHLSKAY